MKFCCRCGVQMEDNFLFCPVCGEKQARISLPAAQTALRTSPQSKIGRVFGFLSMGLGIASGASGVLVGLLCLLFAAMQLSYDGNVFLHADSVGIGAGIAALVFRGIARKQGNYEKSSLLGLILGIVRIAVGALSIILLLVFNLRGLDSAFLV